MATPLARQKGATQLSVQNCREAPIRRWLLTGYISKKLVGHRHALSLYFCFYNWTRIHKTLRVSPAMASGLTDHLWTMEEIVALMDAAAPKLGRPITYKKRAIQVPT
jgi:hypothetical protein